MHNQSFTQRQFSYLSRQGDYWKYFKGDAAEDRQKIKSQLLSEAEETIDTESYRFQPLSEFKINDNTVYTLAKLKKDGSNKTEILRDDYILRKINQNLRRIYKVKQADRFQIIATVKSLLAQPIPFYVCKLDIKSFYENINRGKILSDINGSALVSYETKALLNKFFETLPESITGLPRGINVSATLSEYYMKKFDRFIRENKDFFYYARFVDDIILFSTEPITKRNTDILASYLPEGLSFNKKKLQTHELSFAQKEEERIVYLGYEFICSKIEKNKDIRAIKTRIAPKKIKKIKKRIVSAFLSHKQDRNFRLLQDRLLFLTATYPLKTQRQKLSKYEAAGFLHGGIFYSYPLIDDLDCLQELDVFLNGLLCSQKFSRIVGSLSPDQKSLLRKYSFVQGYKRRISRRYKTDYIKDIVKCWS